MRLKSIKLAGFKSFVDPTTVDLPSNMCAIVGPNGCGKSNVIDAVRWVMGESSAKNLRGESMTDVIFKGSNHRKPVGQASIELIFDNADGSIGGEYAAFAEISVKRKVTAEAQNVYFLNGQKCRRRDITDIFLGTGLGPRSYAIIEQGMISRLIESKPEELRVFIEEAAGISKYKERRRETENRMKRTMENMERLTDIREELERQLQHLHRQAQAAEKFTTLKQEERLFKAQLHALQWQDLNVSVEQRQQDIQRIELDLEAAVTQQTHFETKVESLFVAQHDAREQFNSVQKRFYDLGAEIAKTETLIQTRKDRQQQYSSELERVQVNLLQAEAILRDDKDKQQQWQATLEEILPELELLQHSEDDSQQTLQDVEALMQAWQGKWDDFNQHASDARQRAEVQQSRIQHTEKVLARIDERVLRLQEEIAGLSADDFDDEIADFVEQLAEIDLQLEQDQSQLESLQQQIEQQRQAQLVHNERLDQVNTSLQSKQGRLASLEALQQAALAETHDAVSTWLIQQGLSDNPLLADQVKVEPGYEHALETVLAEHLQSVCVDQINDFVSSVAELDAGALRLLSASDASTAANQAVSLPLLLSKVANPELLSSILAGVYVADTVEQALPALQALSMQESIVTADGLWLSRHWLRKLDQQDAQAGLLKRKQEIEQLHAVIAEQSSEKQALQSSQTDTQLKLSQTERERDELQKSYQLRSTKQSELSSQLSAKKLKVEQVLQRREQIQTDLDDTKLQYQLEQESLAEARAILQQAIEDMESDAGQRESLVSERDNIRSRLDQARDQANSDKDRAYQLAMQEQSLKTQISALQQSLDRAREQVEQLLERRTQLQIEIAEIEQPDDDSALALEALLDKRLTVEQELSAARTELDTIEHDMREVERERNLIQQTIQKHRSDLEQSRIAAQTWQVQQENLQKQIEDAEFSVATLIEELPEHASESVWQEEIESLARRIARLGAINLAAIEEYKLAAERKTYLDAQNADLETALSTLENAIRKIDKETRQRFKDTFDQINLGVQDLFPKVFGGGRAYLELTGDDLLDTGVAIMAQPPGKKNSTIHLLSGGEKALTAIALVFSIFKLNPAPFCILDEVDAPLDDANVGRYARMVKEMSEQVQFIYISHNKIAMEMADQLLGVTMHEPGCSRVVSVDIEEAAELAAL